ncbi:MAG: hypothetical protein L0Y70_02540 [Gemmataceae bacterium]|nr:hypothetical protein [Gemmataceae bacterium]
MIVHEQTPVNANCPTFPWSVAYSSNGKHLVAGTIVKHSGKSAGEVILWDTGSWEAKRILPRGKEDVGPQCVVFSPTDAMALAVGTVVLKDGRQRVFLKSISSPVLEKT